jgi:hypothetical protein
MASCSKEGEDPHYSYFSSTKILRNCAESSSNIVRGISRLQIKEHANTEVE